MSPAEPSDGSGAPRVRGEPDPCRVARAWRDPVFRAGLTDAERERLAPSPVGVPDVTDLPEG
jgi:mersacidin/lichenicidin family type 2 lantibiotic